jgi:hypothetical protein
VLGHGSDDHIHVEGSVSHTTILDGGDGDDHLKSGKGSALMLGGNGDDYLKGGRDRDILIGGNGADRLKGDRGEDILIGDATAYDDDSHALSGILDEWTRLDADYDTRVDQLSNGGVLKGDRVLNETSVFADGKKDKLNGSSGRDWFIADVTQDKTKGKKRGETVTDISSSAMGENGRHIDWGSNWHVWDFTAHKKHAPACHDLEDWSVPHVPSTLTDNKSEHGKNRHFGSMFEWVDYKHSS